MIARVIEPFFVAGKAEPAGSKKAFGFRRRDGSIGASVVDDCKKSRPWKSEVTSVARQHYDGPLLAGPLRVRLTFVVIRPSGHFKTRQGKPCELVKDSAPKHPVVRPDVLKLARAVEDALTQTVYRDDSQIVEEVLVKVYGDRPGVLIEITELEDRCPSN